MLYDPLAVAIAAVRAGIDDVPVTGDHIGHTPGSARVVVSLLNISVAVRQRLDRVRFDFETFGPNKEAALNLAMRVRHVLLDETPAKAFGNVAVTDVTADFGPMDITDPNTREHRFVTSLDMFMYLRS